MSISYGNGLNRVPYLANARELLEATKGLNNEQLDSLISIAKNLKR